ncbi:MAG: Wadjet anti-phage system protein JetA family protein, partial [Spirochaetota bacterium]
TSHARPFFEALDATDRGAAVEYESHIVAVYSSLTGDSAREHGEHAVLNAHYHTRMLIESLKVLEQNIRSHVQSLFDEDQSIPEILRSHYDVYMHEVVDRAYTRLKTSDNLSRYRPRIARAIGGFLKNAGWLEQTAGRLAIIQRTDAASARARVRSMLVEIRDDLASIDPILESIDDRNRRYSRISTERIRAQLHADTSLQGRISALVDAIASGRLAWDSDGVPGHDAGVSAAGIAVKLHRLRFVAGESLYVSRSREVGAESLARPVSDPEEEALIARELELRAAGQLNQSRVAAFLGSRCSRPGESVWAHDLVDGMDGYIRVLYAASYAERPSGSFPYEVEWGEERMEAGGFTLPAHRFIRRHEHG